jgi:chemotaxis protein CheX
MRYNYIEPFITSTLRTLDTVLQSDIAKGDMTLVSGEEINGDVTIIVKLKGDSDGSIIMNMPEKTALNISTVMFGDTFDRLTPDVIDSIAELANMIAGNAMSVLNDMGFDFTVLPPVIITRNDVRPRRPAVEAFQVPVFTDLGEITLNVALRTN